MRGGVQLCGDSLGRRYLSSGSHFGNSVFLTSSVALGKIFCTQTKLRKRDLYPSCKNNRAPQRFRAINLLPSPGLGHHGITESVSLNSSFCGEDWCSQHQGGYWEEQKTIPAQTALNFPSKNIRDRDHLRMIQEKTQRTRLNCPSWREFLLSKNK